MKSILTLVFYSFSNYAYEISSMFIICKHIYKPLKDLPDLMLVMVAGKSNTEGLWVVIPTSMDPDHLSTNTSNRI